MLVLTRKPAGKNRIDEEIATMIVKIIDEFGQIKIGIEAPESLSAVLEES